jgi:3-methyl-2-oxobutanoate hydroxymethyltransferase
MTSSAETPNPDKVRVDTLIGMKAAGRRIAALTAYDFLSAQILDRAGIDLILVGDSLGNVILGHSTTVPVTMSDIIHHARAVSRGVSRALTVADMPFLSYQAGANRALRNAGRLLKKGGVEAVKLEGAGPVLPVIERMVHSGIPVLGHLGYTPQSAHRFGNNIVQAKTAARARELLDDAIALESAGAFGVVLECVPAEVARLVTERLPIPTIGIGAGPFCDGQILVLHDFAGLTAKPPRFVKRYASLADEMTRAADAYRREVSEGAFPAAEHCYKIAPEELRKLIEEETAAGNRDRANH